jgi:hypothetical protein
MSHPPSSPALGPTNTAQARPLGPGFDEQRPLGQGEAANQPTEKTDAASVMQALTYLGPGKRALEK